MVDLVAGDGRVGVGRAGGGRRDNKRDPRPGSDSDSIIFISLLMSSIGQAASFGRVSFVQTNSQRSPVWVAFNTVRWSMSVSRNRFTIPSKALICQSMALLYCLSSVNCMMKRWLMVRPLLCCCTVMSSGPRALRPALF